MKSIRTLPFATAALFFLTAPMVRADDLFVWVEQVGNDVVFRFSGSIDLAGFPAPSPGNANSFSNPQQGDLLFGGLIQTYDPMIPNTQPFGSGANAMPDSTSGNTFGVVGTVLAVPNSYVSQTPISGSMTFLSMTLAALGVNPTPYTIQTAVGDNTIYMFTSPAEFAADLAALRKQIRKLQKKSKKLKKKGKKKKAKKLLKKVKQLKLQLAALE